MRDDATVITNLRDLVRSQEDELNRAHQEIAALREAIRWHNHHERGVPMPPAASDARRRALGLES